MRKFHSKKNFSLNFDKFQKRMEPRITSWGIPGKDRRMPKRANEKNSVWIVSFLESKIPKVAISQVGTVKHGNSVPITCNLTERGSRQDSKLLNVSLIKNNVLIHRANVSEDPPPNSTILLGPFNLKNVGVNDGGNYTCLLEVLLKNKTPYKVTDSTLLTSKCILLILQHFFLYIFVLRSRKYVKGNNWSFPC